MQFYGSLLEKLLTMRTKSCLMIHYKYNLQCSACSPLSKTSHAASFSKHNGFKMHDVWFPIVLVFAVCFYALKIYDQIKCKFHSLNWSAHKHIVLWRTALWLHRCNLDRVVTSFRSPCSIEIHKPHTLLS